MSRRNLIVLRKQFVIKHILIPTSQQFSRRLIANGTIYYVQQFDRFRKNRFLSINIIICLYTYNL